MASAALPRRPLNPLGGRDPWVSSACIWFPPRMQAGHIPSDPLTVPVVGDDSAGRIVG